MITNPVKHQDEIATIVIPAVMADRKIACETTLVATRKRPMIPMKGCSNAPSTKAKGPDMVDVENKKQSLVRIAKRKDMSNQTTVVRTGVANRAGNQ